MSQPVAAWSESGLGKTRIEALTDGMFAIVMTLLVLDIKVPAVARATASEELPYGLLLLWPKILSYAISFVILGVYWVGHHNLFHFIKRSDRFLLWINMFFLMAVAFVPFSTALLSEYGRQPIATLIYGVNQMVAGLSLYIQWWHATRRRRLIDPDLDQRLITAATRRILIAPTLYAAAVPLSFLKPILAVLIYALVPLLYILPGRIDLHWSRPHARP
ncbi:MAG TPA: TMEM175 family protein [Candidatus Polarisedimenticolia bacterium]|nr:TMEM175 family protein [Candidatus Polarisedimenticolia bacterium]